MQAADRLGQPGLFDLLGRAVAGGVVGGGVVAQTVADALQQVWPLALPRTLQGHLQAVVDGDDVVAIHLLTGKAGADGFLRQARGPALDAPRGGDGPLVVVDHEQHRQLPGARDIQSLEKIALAGGAIATGSDRHAVLAAHLERGGHTAGMQGLGGNGYAQRKVLGGGRTGVGTATLVTTPVEKDLAHAHPAQQLHGGIAVIGHQHIAGLHQAANGHADGFLAQGWRVGADPAGTLQGHGFLVEQPGQHHLPVQAHQQLAIRGPGRQLSDHLAGSIQVAGKG